MAITRYSHKGFCPVCGQPILHPYKVKDGEICRECAAKLRVMYPVSYKKNPKPGYTDLRVDPLQEISVNDYDTKLKETQAYRESLRKKYNGANAVFIIEEVRVEKGGMFAAPITNLFGRVLYGNFFADDEVALVHGDRQEKLTLDKGRLIEGTMPLSMTEEDFKRRRDGRQGWRASILHRLAAQEGDAFQFAFDLKDLQAEAGDILVK